MATYLYEAIASPRKDHGFEIWLPDFDLHTQGNDLYEAAYMAQDLLSLAISTYLDDDKPLPTPTMDHKATDNDRIITIAVDCEKGMPEIEYMSVQDAADILDVSTSRIYAMARDGILASKKIGGALVIEVQSVRERFNNPGKPGRPAKKAAAA